MKNLPLRKAFDTHRWLLLTVCLAWLVTALQCAYLGVTWADFLDDFGPALGIVFFKFLLLMLVLAAITFARLGFLWRSFEKTTNDYLSSETFFFGLVGAVVVVSASVIFIIQKCFIPFFNPFGYWDPVFAKWDLALHFGHYPHEYLVPIALRYPLFAQVLDCGYYAWYAVIAMTCTYCLYCDRNLRRRMRYLWSYVIAFLIVGSSLALVFSSVGPLFFSDFMPHAVNPYQGLIEHLSLMNDRVGLHFFAQRHWLLEWVRNDQFIDANSISAMPSMHNATMLFSALYLRTINRTAFGITCGMTVLVFLGSVYTGFHYAIDAYAGYGLIALIWWLTGGLVKRLYPQADLSR
jgi:hypothetical protein